MKTKKTPASPLTSPSVRWTSGRVSVRKRRRLRAAFATSSSSSSSSPSPSEKPSASSSAAEKGAPRASPPVAALSSSEELGGAAAITAPPTTTVEATETSGAKLLLLCVPLLWATYAPALRFVFTASDTEVGSATLSLVRMFLAQLPFLPALGSTIKRSKSDCRETKGDADRAIRAALELGLWNAAATGFQAWGLEHTSSTHSGFMMGTVNILVPTLAVLQGDKVSRQTWAACLVTFIGVLFIGLDSAVSGGLDENVSPDALRGDVSAFASALCYAGLTIRASNYAKEFSPEELMGTKTLVMLVFMLCWYFQTSFSGSEDVSFAFLTSPIVAAVVVYSAYVPGALANYLQLKGQASVSASDAQVIYATTPVFNTFVSVLALGETLSTNTVVGGAVILCASLAPFIGASQKSKSA
jgi:drug/metabolite transporter (DMT)-like permease